MLSASLDVFTRCQDHIQPKSRDSCFLTKYDVIWKFLFLTLFRESCWKSQLCFYGLSQQGSGHGDAEPYQLGVD